MRRRTCVLLVCLLSALVLGGCGAPVFGDDGPRHTPTPEGRPKSTQALLRRMVPTSSWMPNGWSFRQLSPADLPAEPLTEDICGITEFIDAVKIIDGTSGSYIGDNGWSSMFMSVTLTDNGPAVVDTFTTQATCEEWSVNFAGNPTDVYLDPAPEREMADGGWTRKVVIDHDPGLIAGRIAILHIGNIVVRSVVFGTLAVPEETLLLWNSVLDYAINVATTGEAPPAPTSVP